MRYAQESASGLSHRSHEVRDHGEEPRERDQDGDVLERAEQQQRHYHQLLRHDVAAAELEPHSGDGRMGDHQACDHPEVDVTLVRDQQEDRDGRQRVDDRKGDEDPTLARIHAPRTALARLAH